jgi:O-antigen/teichoic acid export membrane protein
MLEKLYNLLVSRWRSDELIRHSAILFAGMVVVHVCSLVYQMAVSRALPPEEYALLAAFLGILAVLYLPLSTMAVAVSHYSSLLCREGRAGDVKRLVVKWLGIAGIPAVLLGSVGLFYSAPLASLLHLDRAEPVIIAAISLPALFLLPVLGGASQGGQQFGWSAASGIVGGLVRLILGAGFVWFVYPACGWAMLGHGLGAYAAAAVLLAGLMIRTRALPVTVGRLPSMRFYIFQSFFIQAAYAVLMTADVVLVKHFLPEDTDFAYAATLGRLTVFLPGAIVTAMFPKVTSDGMATAAHLAIFRRSLLYTAACAALAVAGCALFPGLLLRLLFGIADAAEPLKRMTILMAGVMGVNALLNVAVQFLLARRCFRQSLVVIVAAGAYLGGCALFHASALSIVLLAGIANGLSLAALLFPILSRPGGAALHGPSSSSHSTGP